MADYTDLIARLEKATGPDRELDAAIIVATTPTRSTADDLIYLTETRSDDQCAPGTYWLKQRSGASLHTAPELTASIDSALALVERCLPKLGCIDAFHELEKFPNAWRATIGRGSHKYRSSAPTAPLAILTALLHAVASEKQVND